MLPYVLAAGFAQGFVFVMLVSYPSGSCHKSGWLCGCPGALSRARNAGENLIRGAGPGERSGAFVVNVKIFADGCFEFLDAAENAAANSLVGDFGEPPLHKVHPGAIGGREMNVKARPFGEPFPYECGLVRAVVVQDDVNVEFCGHVCFDRIQKLAELLRTMATMQLADDAAGLEVERG